MTAGEIVEHFAQMMSQPAISKHLCVLENAGLVWREKRGQSIHYELKEDALTGTLAHFLAEVCPRTRPFRNALQRPPDARRVSNQDDGTGTSAWLNSLVLDHDELGNKSETHGLVQYQMSCL